MQNDKFIKLATTLSTGELVDYFQCQSDEEICSLISQGNKSTWQKTVNLYNILGYPRWKKAIPSLLELQQDLNWPGTIEARELLSAIDFNEYKQAYTEAVTEAVNTNDGEWLEHLIFFLLFKVILRSLDEDLIEMCISILLKQASFH